MKTKKIVLFFLFIRLCAAAFAQSAVSLDDALKTAAGQLIEQIAARTKDNVTVAILGFETPSGGLSEYVEADLTKYFLRNRRFMLVERQFLARAREELNFNLSGEVSDSSAQSIGKFVGAQVVVFGSIKQMGKMYRLQARAITSEEGIIIGQETANIPAKDIQTFTGNNAVSKPKPVKTTADESTAYSVFPMVGFDGFFGTNGGSLAWYEFLTVGGAVGVNIQSSKKLFINILGEATLALSYGSIMDGVGFTYSYGGRVELLALKHFLLGVGGGMAGAIAYDTTYPYIRGTLTIGGKAEDGFMGGKVYYDYGFGDYYRLGVLFSGSWIIKD